MESLRQARLALQMPVERLAELLDVSPRVIASWEAADKAPSPAQWSDLALVFGVGAEDLRAGVDVARTIPTVRLVVSPGHLLSPFFGHLGLLMQDEPLTRWYPVCIEEAARLGQILSGAATYPSDWLAVPTLNNRLLVFPLSGVKRLALLDEGADVLTQDWEVSWDVVEPLAAELYAALLARHEESPDYATRFGPRVRSTVEELVRLRALDQDDALDELLLHTRIHCTDGAVCASHVCPEDLAQLVFAAESDMPRVLQLRAASGGLVEFFPSQAVRLVDAPLGQYHAGLRRLGERGELALD